VRTSKKPLLGLCRLCRLVSFGLRDTRLISCRLCHHPLGVTHATQGRAALMCWGSNALTCL